MEGILVLMDARNEINSRIVIQSNMLSQANRDDMIHIKMVVMLVEIIVMLVEIEMLGKRLRL